MADWTPPTFGDAQPTAPLDLRRPATSIPEWDPGAPVPTILPGSDWDRITIAGITLKALVMIEGDKHTKIDVQQIPGSDGANLTSLGASPAPITIRLRFFTPDALQEWSDTLSLLQATPGRPTPNAVDIYHPALAINGIKALYLQSVGVGKIVGPGGPVEVSTRWVEFLPPKTRDAKTITSADRDYSKVKKAAPFVKKTPSKDGAKP